MDQAEVARAFGRAFERCYARYDTLVHTFREAEASALERETRYLDVRNVAVQLRVEPHMRDELADLWMREFGTHDFHAVMPELQSAPPADNLEAEGHSTRPQPEQSASYRPSIVAFLSEHGSMIALQECIREHWRGQAQIASVASACIVLAVAAVENAVSDTERARLRRHPDVMGGEEKEFSLQELMTAGNLDAVIERAVESRIENLCHAGASGWRKWFKKAFGTDLESIAEDWARFTEVVQRRHVIVHNDSRASRMYLQRAGVADVAVGELLSLDREYTIKALDECGVISLRLLLAAWEKLGDDLDHICGHTSNRAYDALVAGQWVVALRLAQETMVRSSPDSATHLIARVNSWLARRALGEDIRAEVEAWDVGALSLLFRVVKVALLDDDAKLADLMPAAVDAGEISRSALITWPVFRDLRGRPLFAEFLEQFR